MPKIIGLTGGIGSGKTRVLEAFKALGVPCYIADSEAKMLMHDNLNLKKNTATIWQTSLYKTRFK